MQVRELGTRDAQLLAAAMAVADAPRIVAELVENAIDAGGTEVEIQVTNYGLDSIEVLDNGSGIPMDGREHVLRSRASGKAYGESLGFRGEALFAIGLLADVEICTRTIEESIGVKLTKTSTNPVAMPPGTRVRVKDIFREHPVRRREMERAKTKTVQAILLVCVSLALANPQISFRLVHITDTRRVLLKTAGRVSSPFSTLIDAFSSAFGVAQASKLREINIDKPLEGIKITGALSHPPDGFTNSSRLFMSLFNRPVELPEIKECIINAYRRSECKLKPFGSLSLTLPLGTYDVNVAPDKQTVVFKEETGILRVIREEFQHVFSTAVSQTTSPIVHLNKKSPSSNSNNISNKFLDAHEEPTDSNTTKQVSSQSDREAEHGPSTSPAQDIKSKLSQFMLFGCGIPSKSVPGVYCNQPREDKSQPIIASQDNKDESNKDTDLNNNPEATTKDKSSDNDDIHSITDPYIPNPTTTTIKEENINNTPERYPQYYPPSETVSFTALSQRITHTPNIKRLQRFCQTEEQHAPSNSTQTQSVADTQQVYRAETQPSQQVFEEFADGIAFTKSRAISNERLREDAGEPVYIRRRFTLFSDLPTTINSTQDTEDTSLVVNTEATVNSITADNSTQADEEVVKHLSTVELRQHLRVLGQFNMTFILAELGGVLFMLDQHATDEAARFEVLCRNINKHLHKQPLVCPIKLELSPVEMAVMREVRTDMLSQLGLDVTIRKVGSSDAEEVECYLNSCSILFKRVIGEAELREVLANVAAGREELCLTGSPACVGSGAEPRCVREVLASKACKSSVRLGDRLSNATITRLVSRWARSEYPFFCPHGRPVVRVLSSLSSIHDMMLREGDCV